MQVLIYCFLVLLSLNLIGCPETATTKVREGSEISKSLPMCFYSISGNSVIKSIKVTRENGEERYFACGKAYEIPDNYNLGECDLQGRNIFLEAQDSSATGLTGIATEISEHCIDDPISGRCKKWNCEELTNLIPYPSGCYEFKERATGSCSEMWGD